MKPIHIHEEYPEHDWRLTDEGEIDTFASEEGFHNGPLCKRCYHSFCVHCNPDGYTDELPCTVDEWKCPTCEKRLYTGQHFCDDCGTKIDWDDSKGEENDKS